MKNRIFSFYECHPDDPSMDKEYHGTLFSPKDVCPNSMRELAKQWVDDDLYSFELTICTLMPVVYTLRSSN